MADPPGTNPSGNPSGEHPRRLLSVLQVVRPARGGIRAHVERLVRGLPAHGVRVAVAGPLAGPDAWDLPEGIEARSVPIPDRMRPAPDLRAARALREAMAVLRPDLLHAHGYRAAWIASLALRSVGRDAPRLIVTAHNLLGDRTPVTASLALRLVDGSSARWIAITEAVKRTLEAAGVPARRIAVIPNGIDPEAMAAGDARRVRCDLGIPEDAPLIEIVARLEPAKGVSDGLRAFAMLRRAFPYARLLVVGDGPESRALVDLAGQLGLRSAVRFLGWRDDAGALLAAADACLIPSRLEGQSLVALEAMALGVPVVASAAGGLPEMIRDGETGLLARPGSAPELARGLSQLLRDPALRERLSEAAGKEVRERWSEAAMLRRTADLYRQTAAP